MLSSSKYIVDTLTKSAAQKVHTITDRPEKLLPF